MATDTDRWLKAVENARGDVTAASNALGIPEASFRRALKKEGLWDHVEVARVSAKNRAPLQEPEGLTDEDGIKVGIVQPDSPWSAEELIRFYGDDPEECQILSKRGTFYGNPAEPNHHLRVNWISKNDLIRAPDPNDWTPPPKPKKRRKEKYLDAVVISDHHAPFHEKTFHRLFLAYLADAQPGLIEVNGDLLDFESISRHRSKDDYAATVNECLKGGFGILRDYREVCPDAQIRYKRGNHEERLNHLIIDNATGLHRVTPANDEIPALDLRRLLHLDELHVDYIDQDWEQAKTRIGKKLTAIHGLSTSKNAGDAILDRISGSTNQGHDHRLGVTFRSEYEFGEDDDPLVNVRGAFQGGCACIIPGGLGYVKAGQPNWQNACWTHRVWDNGDFHSSYGLYVTGRFFAPNGERYTA